ncbi:unnamed protein product, partial [marine sediment metagenome]
MNRRKERAVLALALPAAAVAHVWLGCLAAGAVDWPNPPGGTGGTWTDLGSTTKDWYVLADTHEEYDWKFEAEAWGYDGSWHLDEGAQEPV